MLVVETIAKIRRAYFQNKKPIKEICRELRVSRKTMRKVVRSGATEFNYERSVQPLPKIGPWQDKLEAMLAENARRPRRERLTHIRIFEELRAEGSEGGYDAVRRYAAAWSKAESAASAAAYVPLSFDPGEAYQFDWSHEVVVMDGVTTTVKVAHVRLCHSRMPFSRGPAPANGHSNAQDEMRSYISSASGTWARHSRTISSRAPDRAASTMAACSRGARSFRAGPMIR
jgi:transposase